MSVTSAKHSNVGADILVVDDNPANLVAIEAALSGLDATVVRARSGGEALRLMLDHDFALVLLDVNMPSMGGFETARIIRARKRSSHTPIIFITAYGRDDVEVLAAYGLGAVDFLFKPIVPEILNAKAAVFVELQRRTEEVALQAQQIREHQRREHERTLAEERHRWEERALRREMEQLEETDRRKDQFLAILAHELRTPLSPIVTGFHLLRSKLAQGAAAEESALRTCDTMERQARHLTRLVDDLLDISRISQGKIVLQNGPLDLRTIITQAIAAAQPLIDERRHRLLATLSEEPVGVLGDEVRLIQIVTNLINNAARYTDDGGELFVSCRAVDDFAEVRVVDNGLGIAPELLAHVFDIFVQEHPAKAGGLGLGLSVVSRLVELHRGSVVANSAGHGRGSEFVVKLPLLHDLPDMTQLGSPHDELSAAVNGSDRGSKPQSPKLKIVLVEDNDDIREMMCDLLTLWHHQVVVAESGERGVELIMSERPDIALVDIGLPGLDGYGVAREVRAHWSGKRLPLVAMTGYGQEVDRMRSRNAGFDLHLVKPVSVDALKAVLSSEEPYASRPDP